MLEALARGKPHIKRKLPEDAVTSCIFGPLIYLKGQNYASEIYDLFACLLPQIVPSGDRGIVQSMQLDLWPKLGRTGTRRPEPDILIRFTDNNSNVFLAIMVEVKWGAGQYNYDVNHGRFELSEQWAYLDSSLRGKAHHIYLVLDKLKANKEIKNMNDIHNNIFPYEGISLKDWRKRFSVVGWPDFVKALRQYRFSELGNWASTVVSFLEKTGKVDVWQGCASAVRDGKIKYIILGKPLYFNIERQLFINCSYGNKVKMDSASKIFWKKREGFISQIGKLKNVEVVVHGNLFFTV